MSPTLALRRLIADAGHDGVVTVAAVTAALAESEDVVNNIFASARPPHKDAGCRCNHCKAIADAVRYLNDAKAMVRP